MKSLREVMNEFSAKERQSIRAEIDRLDHKYQTLQQLREAKKLTQNELAARLNIRQATIAQTEKRSDMLLSTLRSYVEQMGGTLKLTAEFPGQEPVILTGFRDLDETETA
ncbi:MAG: XRE family transcriptional regulator [Pseudomonadota bacterium]